MMDEYKILSFELSELSLFFRLDGKKAEHHGAIGYMRADFGRSGKEFWSTWFDIQARLKIPAFKSEFQKVVEYLREGMQYPVFSNRRDMEAFCLKYAGQRVEDRGIGFKVQTDNYSYYARCRPTSTDYDIMLYAYDNKYLLPELAGQNELPNNCFTILPSSGEVILIVYGEQGYHQTGLTTNNSALNRQIVNTNNALMDVTRAQEEAMLAGSLFGWNTPGAKPWRYEQDGAPRPLPPKNKDEHER